MKNITRPKILFFVTEDWFFCSHFADRAAAALEAGYEVSVLTRVSDHAETIMKQGFRIIPFEMKRNSVNMWLELKMLYKLIKIYRYEKPDIVHHVALKPILYGTIAALITGVKCIVNAPVGMGYVFTSRQWRAKLSRPFIMFAYRLLMNPNNSRVIFENPDDVQMLLKAGAIKKHRVKLIRGAGVNLDLFSYTPEPDGTPIVILAARMLWDKGVGEFVEAARRLREGGVAARFVLVGDGDMANPATVPISQLKHWHESRVIEWWGRRTDMQRVFAQSHIVCLPSYREGLPKALIEAAACGRSIITTDVPGCREVVRHGENGFLVPVRDVAALAEALRRLIEDAEMRRRMGAKGREIAMAEFSVERVVGETLDVYRQLLSAE